MKLSSLLVALSTASPAWATSTSAADGIVIEVTHKVTCDRKTHNNDVISMTYALSLANGTKIESSECPKRVVKK